MEVCVLKYKLKIYLRFWDLELLFLATKEWMFVRDVFDMGQLTGRDHRNAVASDIVIKMQEQLDEAGEPFFKPDEILDVVQIKSLFYR